MKIIIDPRCRISYASYYISGLWEIFGKQNVLFRMQPFKDLKQTIAEETFDQYFAFILKNKNIAKRVIVDYRDKSNINTDALKWADVYAKVNFNTNDSDYLNLIPESKNKIIPIGTNFGIKIWKTFDTTKYLFLNYFRSVKYLPVNFRTFLSGYNWQLKRETIDFYRSAQSREGYVFHASSLYMNQQHGEMVNSLRAMFIRTCKSKSNCTFEGGLMNRSINQSSKQYSDVITDKYYPVNQYLHNIKKSAFVFNTPAAWSCHGWKLGEYLAMGKAIISTPFINDMPEKMIHGENILFVESDEEMKNAVNLLLSDNALRQRLEKGSKDYYSKWVKPDLVIRRILIETRLP